jgi:hypothetical protein
VYLSYDLINKYENINEKGVLGGIFFVLIKGDGVTEENIVFLSRSKNFQKNISNLFRKSLFRIENSQSYRE